MENLAQHIVLLFIPMILGNSIHMVLVKKNALPYFNRPISTKYFGQNKTYRGFLLLPIISAVISLVGSYIAGPFLSSHWMDALLTFGMGFAYLFAELPNSFVKRKLNIPNGGFSTKYKTLQIIIDRADSMIGIFIYYYFLVCISLTDTLILFICAMFLSFGTSLLLNLLKIKRSI
ncbi:MAG: CDP-archaeol synthase [Flavobacteriales bacterium]